MLMKLPLVSVRLCSNRGDLAFGVVAIDDELEDEEEDDGKTPVSDKDGTESELSEVRVEEKKSKKLILQTSLREFVVVISSLEEEPGTASSDIHTEFVKGLSSFFEEFYDYVDVRSSKIRWDFLFIFKQVALCFSGFAPRSLLMASGVEFGVSLTSEEDECFSRAY
ncbi:hypothetical protein U1Q18_040751 [Sarracenia purpurea var. burkii]